MIGRLIISLGTFAFGYYVGREVGRMHSVREELRKAGKQGTTITVKPSTVDIDDEHAIHAEVRKVH